LGEYGLAVIHPWLVPQHSEPYRVAFFVYILASKPNGTLYIGMTDHLVKRVWQHRNGVLAGFTQRYGVKMLVWFERHESRESAFRRERQLKKWNRAWKLGLIEKENPRWRDLWDEVAS
jgi:putative endonuclease